MKLINPDVRWYCLCISWEEVKKKRTRRSNQRTINKRKKQHQHHHDDGNLFSFEFVSTEWKSHYYVSHRRRPSNWQSNKCSFLRWAVDAQNDENFKNDFASTCFFSPSFHNNFELFLTGYQPGSFSVEKKRNYFQKLHCSPSLRASKSLQSS